MQPSVDRPPTHVDVLRHRDRHSISGDRARLRSDDVSHHAEGDRDQDDEVGPGDAVSLMLLPFFMTWRTPAKPMQMAPLAAQTIPH